MEAIEWSNVEFINNDAVLSLYNEVGMAGWAWLLTMLILIEHFRPSAVA